jgi:hydrogenase assembly chaperone HypC/HupF
MCLEFPARVVGRDGDVVTVDVDGRRRRALALLFPDLELGDWVLVAAGTVIEQLDVAQAAQLIADISVARGETG